MKIRKWLTLAIPLTLTLGSLPIAVTACGQSNIDKTPTVKSKVSDDYNYYEFAKQDDQSYTYHIYSYKDAFGQTHYPSLNITYFNDEFIPYVNLDTYINSIDGFYCRTANGITLINSIYTKEWCLIDYKAQTITFSDWDGFTDYNWQTYGHLTEGCGGGENYYKSVKQIKYFRGKNQKLDLSDYNIKAYIHKEAGATDPSGFLPFELVNNLFNIEMYIHCDFNGRGLYEVVAGNTPRALAAKSEIKERSTIYEKEDYRMYCINLFALTLDCRFGLKQRESRSHKGQYIKYLPKGAYNMLSKYYSGLMSSEDNVRNNTLLKIFTQELDDGGHARYVNLDAFTTKNYTTGAEKGVETKHTFAISDAIEAQREKVGTAVWQLSGAPSAKENKACGFFELINGYDHGNVAYITFDSFKAPQSDDDWSAEELAAGRELPSNTTKDNHYLDTLRLTMYANDMIKNPVNNVKNVVIDISNNGGGTVYTEHFIASWLLGGVTEKIYNPTTGGYCEYEVKADINGDGEFDSKDYITDVNLYVITSSSSFSCGNMLPCNIVDCASQRSAKTVLMGTKSGGGACFVDNGLNLGCSTYYRSSSTFHMLRNSSYYNHYKTVDDGAEITSGWEMDDTNPVLFTDRAAILTKIWSNK